MGSKQYSEDYDAQWSKCTCCGQFFEVFDMRDNSTLCMNCEDTTGVFVGCEDEYDLQDEER